MISSLRVWTKLIGFVFILVWYFIGLMINTYVRGKNPERGFRIRRHFCRAVLKIFGIRVLVHGGNHTRTCLYVSNHRSMLDPLIELSIIDAIILSKSEVDRYPLIGRGARETGVVFVDRQNRDSRKSALLTIEKLLLEGCSIMIYPEGTTNGGHLTADFRKGAFEIAQANHIPVIPVSIEYPDKSYYWTEGSLLGYFKRKFSGAGKHIVHLQIGHEIYAEMTEELVQKAKSSIDQMILAVRESSW